MCGTSLIGYCVFIHGQTGKGGAEQMEFYSLHKVIFRGFCHFQSAALESVAEGDNSGPTADDGNSLRFLRLIPVIGDFCNGILARLQISNRDGTIVLRSDGFIHTIACHPELHTGDLAILRVLHDFGFTVAYLEIQIGINRIRHTLAPGDGVLNLTGYCAAFHAIGPDYNAQTLCALGCCDCDPIRGRFLCGNRQCISRLGYRDTGGRRGDRKIAQHTVGISQFQHIRGTVPFQFIGRGTASASGHERGNHIVVLNRTDNSVVCGDYLGAQRMIGTDRIQNFSVAHAVRIHMVKICITFADDGLPDQNLCGHDLSQRILIGRIVYIPGRRIIPGIAILENTANMGFDRIGINGRVQIVRIVLPEILTAAAQLVTAVLVDTGLDTVHKLTGVGIHASG